MPQQHEWVISSSAIDEKIATVEVEMVELRQKLAACETRLSSLEGLKRQLQEEFGDVASVANGGLAHALPASLSGRKATRKDQVIEYLLKRGSQKRSLIASETKIPSGTVAGIMGDRSTFRGLSGKRWDVTEEIRKRAAQQRPIQESNAGSDSIEFPVARQMPKPQKDKLAVFLIRNGPKSRVEIVKANVVPEGTISYCLKDDNIFIQPRDGMWDVTDGARSRLQAAAIREAASGGAIDNIRG
jgi:hypothetical protein